jgi:aromatic ring-opening dioxygenase LigB subunit
MPLSLVAVVPHSPLLLDRIGGERTASLGPTLDALHSLAAEIAQAHIETLLIIGDHGSLRPDRLTLCLTPSLHLQLRQFGDVTIDRHWQTDIALGNAIREYSETNLPLTTVAPEELGYAVGVPLLFLTENSPQLRVVCLGPALLPAEDHNNLGAALRHITDQTTARVALIVAGDVPEGSQEFTTAITTALSGDTKVLLDAARWSDSPQSLAWRSLVTLLGAIEGVVWQPEILAEQHVYDTGLLTAVLRQ